MARAGSVDDVCEVHSRVLVAGTGSQPAAEAGRAGYENGASLPGRVEVQYLGVRHVLDKPGTFQLDLDGTNTIVQLD